MIKLDLPNIEYTKKEIADKGFVILKKVVPEEFIHSQKKKMVLKFFN